MANQNFRVKNGLEVGSVEIASSNGIVNAAAIANSGVTAGTVGNTTAIPVITVDSRGFITNLQSASVSGVSGFTWDANTDTLTVSTADGSSYSANISGEYASAAQGTLADSAVQPNDSPTFGSVTVTGTVDGRDVAADGTKLDGIEAAADVTDATNVQAAGALMDSEVTNLADVKSFDPADYATAAQGTTADAALPKTGGAMTGAITTNSTFDGRDVATDGAKLDGIETGATADQTAAEILTAIKTVDGAASGLDADLLDGNHASAFATAAQGALADSALQSETVTSIALNVNSLDYTDENGTTTNIDLSAYLDEDARAIASGVLHAANGIVTFTRDDATTFNLDLSALLDDTNLVTSVAGKAGVVTLDADDISDTTTTNKFTTASDISKLAGIEAGATADQTGAQIKTAYEAEANTNAYTDAEKTKLAGIEANATADQTGAQIKTAYEAEANTNAYTDAEKTKLAGIEASADVTDTTNVTAAGALMDSEVTNLAQVKAFDSSDYATAAQGTKADSAQQPLAEGAFVDGDKTKLDGIEAGADVTDATNVQAAGALMDSEVTNLAQVKAFDSTNYATAAQGTTADSAVQPNDSPTFGSITVTGTVDSRDIAADGTKLDGIEAGADVTDTTNVTAAGALMDSEVTNLAAVKSFNPADYATAAQGTLATNALPKSGGTMTGAIVLPNDPTADLQAATKQYVDTVAAASLHYHVACRAEYPDNLPGTYDNGTAGVGATLTNNGTQAALVVDGVSVNVDDRVLLYEQTDATQNGIYTVTAVGSGSTNWVLTRATDADSYGASDPDALGEGDAFFITEGNTAAGELYVMNTAGTITFGTTEITFVQVSSAQIYTAGTGIDLNGVTFSLDSSTQTSLGLADSAQQPPSEGAFANGDKTKLDGIEANATADQTGAQIKTAYEAEANTNAYTDAEKTKLAGIETNATADQTGAQIKAAYEAEADTNAYTDTEKTKLANIESGATADQTGAEIKTASGGGTGNLTLNAGAGVGITVNADDIAVNAQTGLQANSTGLYTNDSQIVHDNLSGFVANEHIDHTTVSITAGNGLTGGGTIAATRSLAVGAGTGVTVNSTAVSIGQAVATTSNVTFNNVDVNGDLRDGSDRVLKIYNSAGALVWG